MAARSSRRKFLRKLATGLPALAAGGALAHTGVLLAKGKKRAGDFPGDPADRVLVATAVLESARLVTRDSRIRKYAGVDCVW